MATKRCCYKNCDEYTTPTHPSTETFYSFPKDHHRVSLWMALGGCSESIPINKRFYCSKHFDETKYVASNPRRKQLLSTAVPWPYRSSAEREPKSNDEADYQCVVSTMDDVEDEYESSVVAEFEEEISVEVGNEITDTIEEALQNYDYEHNEFTIFTDKRPLKRKLESLARQSVSESTVNQSAQSAHNIVSKRATSSKVISDCEEYISGTKESDELDDTKLLESSNVTTFIFKGQEYVQMPKAEYISEKLALMDKVKAYENILKDVKHLLDGVII